MRTSYPLSAFQPILGRNFTLEECRPHAPRVALLSYGLWRSRYAGDPKILGRSVSLNGEPVQIIGVLPSQFEMPTLTHADLLIPAVLDEAGMRRHGPQALLRTFGRLKPGVTVSQARAALQPLFDQAMTFVPAAFRNEVHLSVRSLRDRQMGDAKLASPDWRRRYMHLMMRREKRIAKVAMARKLAVRLYWHSGETIGIIRSWLNSVRTRESSEPPMA